MAGYRPSFILQFYGQRLMPRWIHNYTRVLMPYLNRCDSLIVINSGKGQKIFEMFLSMMYYTEIILD